VRFTNESGLPAAWTVGFERDGREMLIVIAKATYTLPLAGKATEMAPEQVPLVEADTFYGEPGLSAPMYETDFAHRKGSCDVLLIGSAYAPHSEPVKEVPVGLAVGPVNKQFRVLGERAWYKGAFGLASTATQPFTVQPISYDVAFGGTDRTDERNGRIETYLPNPVGKGYWRHHGHIDGQPLPNTEELQRPVSNPDGPFVPMAFSPLGRSWTPRNTYAGTYDQNWMENEAPFWPADFDQRYFQAAPADQIMPYPIGGEVVSLRNLTPEGDTVFRLPERRVSITFMPHKGRDVTLHANIDTIVLEPDCGRFTLTWRANLRLGKSIFDVKETLIGDRSRAWHRARRSPGILYFENLDQAVRHRRARRSQR